MWLILNFLDWLPTFFSWFIPASPPSPAEAAAMAAKAVSTAEPFTLGKAGWLPFLALCFWIGVAGVNPKVWFHAINTVLWTMLINMWARIILGEHAYIFNWGYGWTLAFLPITNLFRTVAASFIITYPTYQFFRGGSLWGEGFWNLRLDQLGLGWWVS
jgi:hypothetical protein